MLQSLRRFSLTRSLLNSSAQLEDVDNERSGGSCRPANGKPAHAHRQKKQTNSFRSQRSYTRLLPPPPFLPPSIHPSPLPSLAIYHLRHKHCEQCVVHGHVNLVKTAPTFPGRKLVAISAGQFLRWRSFNQEQSLCRLKTTRDEDTLSCTILRDKCDRLF